jgi:hypothetical protein
MTTRLLQGIYVDVLQVMLASAANDDFVLHFRGLITKGTGARYCRRRAETLLGNEAVAVLPTHAE